MTMSREIQNLEIWNKLVISQKKYGDGGISILDLLIPAFCTDH